MKKFHSFMTFLWVLINFYIFRVSAQSGEGGVNPGVILMVPIVFLLVMLIFTWRSWWIPRQKEAADRQLLRDSLIAKNSTLPQKRQKAVAQLTKLAHKDTTRAQIQLLAKLSMIEFSLLRIKEEKDISQVALVKNELDECLKIAQDNLLNKTIIDIYIMQSKVKLFEGDIEGAKRLLTKAELLAEQKGYKNLLEKIMDEQSTFYNDEFLAGLKEVEPSLKAVQVNIDDQLFISIQDLKDTYSGLQSETPVWIMIMNSTGVTLYSQKFLAGLYIDDQLFGGFITAINKFSKEVFGDEGQGATFKTVSSSIDYIKYGEFNLILKPVENYLFCYVIKGKTDDAKNVLETITFQIRSNSDIWQTFKEFDKTQTVPIEINQQLNDIVEWVLFPDEL